MAEIKDFFKTSVKIGKTRGVYTGDAFTGLLFPIPEGFGEFVTTDKKVTLKGQFKNGSFVNGKAETEFVTCWGSFDNFTWLGGGDARLEFKNQNGSFIEGKIDPETKNFLITNMQVADEVYGDSFVVMHKIDPKTQKSRLVGKQIFKNNSEISGFFECDGINRNILSQNGKLPQLTCVEGDCHLVIQDFAQQKVEISGKYKRNLDTNSTKITGIYSLNNSSEKISLVCDGVFDFTRKAEHSANTKISEMFGAMDVRPNISCVVGLNMRTGGKIKLNTESGSFSGTKIASKDGSGAPNYSGEMHVKNHSIALNGVFDKNLVFQNGEFEAKSDKESVKFVFDGAKITRLPNSTIKYANIVHGTYAKKDFYADGVFDAGVNVTYNKFGVIESASLTQSPEHISGEVRHQTADGSYFVGELLSNDQRLEGYKLPAIAKNMAIKKIYSGNFYKTDEKDGYIFNQKGIFSEGYHHEFGKTYMINALGTGKVFAGDYDSAKGYKGTLTDTQNGDFADGVFDTKLNFRSGKFRRTYDNRSIFEGETADCEFGKGTLYRPGDFVKTGEFEFDHCMDPTFLRGDIIVGFEDGKESFCEGKYDCDGLKLLNLDGQPLFDNAKYLLMFKNDECPNGETVVDSDLTDAYTKFLQIVANRNAVEGAEISSAPDKKTAVTKPIELKKEQKKEAGETPKDKKTTARYVDAVEVAGDIINSNATGGSSFDVSLAQQMMSRLINPNKEASQNKE